MSDPPTRPGTADHELVAAGAPTHAAEQFMQRDRTKLERLQGLLHRWEVGSPLIVLIFAFIAFAIIVGSNFYSPSTLSTTTQQVMIAGTLAIAQSLVILTAGIDLSVGFLMVLSSVVMGRLAVDAGWPTPIALLMGLLVGLAGGLLNGLLVTRFRLPPFITTLGTLSIFQSLNLYISKSQTIGASTLEADAPMLTWLGKTYNILGFDVRAGVLAMLAIFPVAWILLGATAWWRHIREASGDPSAPRLAGLRPSRILSAVYIALGLLCTAAVWVISAAFINNVARLVVAVPAVLAIFALTWFVLSRTAWGRHISSVGSDAKTPRLARIPTHRALPAAFGIVGLLCVGAAALAALGPKWTIATFGLNTGVMVMLVMFALVWFALNWTAWGRHVYAVGSDANAARLAGIRTDRVLLSVYVVAGLLCAVAAWISIGRNAVSPQANSNALELQSITAVVIGGISLFGGRGSVIGALIGAVIVGIFASGLPLAGLDVLWVNFAIGVLVIAAVALDQWIRRVKA